MIKKMKKMMRVIKTLIFYCRAINTKKKIAQMKKKIKKL